MNQSPCFNCICLAMCRHKHLEDLLCKCQLVRGYTEFMYTGPAINAEYYESDNYNFDKLVEIFQAVKPTKWTLDSTYSGR